MKTCSECNSPQSEFTKLDGGFKLRLRESGRADSIPDEVCNNCYGQFSALIAKGAQTRVKENAKQQHKMGLWRNRMSLIKQARVKMESKHFAEAAVHYEKYLRVLEIIYEVEAGKLSPELFKNRARSKELTLITSVYWDLVRIYDSSNRYQDRLQKAIDKLIAFAPHSGIVVKLMKNAASYMRSAKNPAVFKSLEKQFGIQRKGCFIATAVFEGGDAPEVLRLQRFRDQHLETNMVGRCVVSVYYRTSPVLVPLVANHPRRKKIFRLLLRKIIGILPGH